MKIAHQKNASKTFFWSDPLSRLYTSKITLLLVHEAPLKRLSIELKSTSICSQYIMYGTQLQTIVLGPQSHIVLGT